jgi:2-oxoglutarate dehydrogenase E2 component (dihydrolipoamide succinyltransferase)
MSIDVPIPSLGESVSEGVIVRWLREDGAAVGRDEALFELETDKASVEVPAPEAGVVHILQPQGATVRVGDIVARIEPGAAAAPASADAASDGEPGRSESAAAAASLSPAVRRLVEENALDPRDIAGSGRGGRLTKADVVKHLEAGGAQPTERTPPPAATTAESPAPGIGPPAVPREPTPYPPRPADEPGVVEAVERVPMSRLRQRIAARLLQAQHGAAILTTFNEIDMSAVMSLRSRHKERFAAAHGVSLGFMSFFARACIAAIRDVPVINAQIDGSDVVHHKHVHLGIAVGTERGLVVPILPRADLLSFAGLEKGIERLAALARDNKLAIADLSGGTFTISNGGVYGSLLSTPILNPPQSAILGMHKIEKRPIAVDDQVVIRPMMYVALSYDHRLIDGAEAVTFLVRVKERLENPERLLLEI